MFVSLSVKMWAWQELAETPGATQTQARVHLLFQDTFASWLPGSSGVSSWSTGQWPGLHGSPLVSEKKRHNGTSPKARNMELSQDQGKEKLCLQVKKALEATWIPLNCSYLDATHLQEAMFKPSLRHFYTPLPNPDLGNIAFL